MHPHPEVRQRAVPDGVLLRSRLGAGDGGVSEPRLAFPSLHGRPPSASGHRVVDDAGDAPAARAHVLVGEMGVALGRAGVGMAEQAPDGVEVEAAHHRMGGERVAAVVEAHVVEPGERAQRQPARAEVGHRPVARAVGKHERAAARQGVEDGAGGRGKLNPSSARSWNPGALRGCRVSTPT